MNIEIFNVILFILFAVVWIAGSIVVISLVASVLVKNITEGFDSYFQFGY